MRKCNAGLCRTIICKLRCLFYRRKVSPVPLRAVDSLVRRAPGDMHSYVVMWPGFGCSRQSVDPPGRLGLKIDVDFIGDVSLVAVSACCKRLVGQN